MRSLWQWLRTVAAVVALAALLVACSGQSSLPKVGQTAPDLTLTRLEGGTVKLSDLRGKVVLLNFWASYCDPCRAEMPAMEKVYKEVADEGGVVLAVDWKESPEKVKAFVEEQGLTFPIAVDEKGAAASIYGVTLIPSSFVIDKEGVLRFSKVGQMEEETIRHYFTTLR